MIVNTKIMSIQNRIRYVFTTIGVHEKYIFEPT